MGSIAPRTRFEPPLLDISGQCVNHYATYAPLCNQPVHTFLSMWLSAEEVGADYHRLMSFKLGISRKDMLLLSIISYSQCSYIYTSTAQVELPQSTWLVHDPGHGTSIIEVGENGKYCTQSRIQTCTSCHSMASLLIITPPKPFDVITITPLPPPLPRCVAPCLRRQSPIPAMQTNADQHSNPGNLYQTPTCGGRLQVSHCRSRLILWRFFLLLYIVFLVAFSCASPPSTKTKTHTKKHLSSLVYLAALTQSLLIMIFDIFLPPLIS